jgi:hypothetical protein
MKLTRRFLHLVTGDQAARETFSAILTPSTVAGGAEGERCMGWPVAGGRWAIGISHHRRLTPGTGHPRAGNVAAASQRGFVDPVPLQPPPR